MRKYILILATVLLFGCSSDYLNVNPKNSTTPDVVFQTTVSAKSAINGLAKLMTRQYASQGMNGEGAIKLLYGNYPGNHFYRKLPGWASVINLSDLHNNNNYYGNYAWYYYYKLISNANEFIHRIDGAIGPDKDKQHMTGQALVYRAYSFFMLSQLFSDRWIESNNGSTNGIILRTEPTMDDIPLSTLAETYNQIYEDLEKAIELFEKSGIKRDVVNNNFDPDASVAHAILARAALTKQDYEKAAKHAKLARVDYKLMLNSDYTSGFAEPTSEWIWGSYGAADENLYYYSFQSQIAWNSNASSVTSYPAGTTRALYKKIPETDIRRKMFLDPGDDYELSPSTIVIEDEKLIEKYYELFPGIHESMNMQPYMQFKFGCIGQPGVGHLVHIRASEMYLIEAEALHFLNKDTEAQKLLIELTKNSGRDPEYDCTVTGEDLFKEIKLYRLIELWGEGFEFFDLKRWGDSRVRASINAEKPEDRDVFTTSLDINIKPDECNNWVYAIPSKESDFNDEIK